MGRMWRTRAEGKKTKEWGQGVLRAQGSKRNSVEYKQYSAIERTLDKEPKATPWPLISCGLRQGGTFKWEKVFSFRKAWKAQVFEGDWIFLSKIVNYLIRKYHKFISPQNF